MVAIGARTSLELKSAAAMIIESFTLHIRPTDIKIGQC